MKDDCVESTSGLSFDDLYDLDAELGSGVFSVVRLGIHKETGDEYAIKIINKPEMEEFDKKCLRQEIDVLSLLRHEHVIRLYDVFDCDALHVQLVLEIVHGGELLDRLIEKTNYTEKEARDVCKIVMEAVAYCHENKIAHRDLKPENLLLTSATDDTTIKIADFGFAKYCPTDESLKTQCGSAQHVAPEILHNAAYGTKVDMWALGVIHYTLIGGYPPFYAGTNQATFQKILKADVVFEDTLWGHVHDDCKDMIRGLLTVDPNDRWSAKQVLDCQWMHDDADELGKTSLHVNQERLRAFNAQQKLKAAVYALIGLNRLQYNGEISALSEEEETQEEQPEEEYPYAESDELDDAPAVETPVDADPTPEAEPDVEEAINDETPEPEESEEEEAPDAEPIEQEEVETPPAVEPIEEAEEEEAVEPDEKVEECAAPVIKEPQQCTPSSIPADTRTESKTVVTRDLYAAFNLAECAAEPDSKEYFALAAKTGDFFTSVLKELHGDNFTSVDVTLRKSEYNSSQPTDEYNVYIDWDITAHFASSADELPTRRELCRPLVKADLVQYLLDYVRPLEETAFELVTNVYFGHYAC